MAYSQRFHDIAALFDEAENETEITTTVGSSILGVSRELSSYLGGNSLATAAIAKAAAAAAGVSTSVTRATPSIPSSSSGRRIIPSSEWKEQQQQQYQQPDRTEYESFSSAHNKYAEQQQQQQEDNNDSDSVSSDDLSTEAEPGRQYYSPQRQRQSFVTMIRMQKQFNEKARKQEQQQRHLEENEQEPPKECHEKSRRREQQRRRHNHDEQQDPPPPNELVVLQRTNSTDSCPLSPTLSPPKLLEREPQQPNELVLNNTDSTDSCTLSLNTSGDDNRSPSSANTMNGNLSYEFPSPIRSWQPQQRQPQRQYHQQQQETFLASPSLQEGKKKSCSTPATAPTTPSSASPKPKEHLLKSQPQEQEKKSRTTPTLNRSWKARQFRRTFRHRASIARHGPTASESGSTIGIRPRSPSMIPSLSSTPSNDSSSHSNISIEYPQPQQQQQQQQQQQHQPPQQQSPQQQETPTGRSTDHNNDHHHPSSVERRSTRRNSKAKEGALPVPQPLSPQRITPTGVTDNVFRQSAIDRRSASRRNNTTNNNNNNNAHTGSSLLDTCTDDESSPSLLSSRPGDRYKNIKTTSSYDIPSIQFSPVRNLRSIFEKKEEETAEDHHHEKKKNRQRLLVPPSRFRSYPPIPTREEAMRNVNVNVNNVAHKEEPIIETISSVVTTVVDDADTENNNNNTRTASSSFPSYYLSSSPTFLPQTAPLSPVRSLRNVFEKKNAYHKYEPPTKQPVEVTPPSQEEKEEKGMVVATIVEATLASKEEEQQEENLHADQDALSSSSSSSLVSSSIQNLRNTLDKNQRRDDPDPTKTKKKNRLNHHIGRQQKRQVVAYPNPKSPARTLETVPLSCSQAEDEDEDNDCDPITNNEVDEGIVAPPEQHRAIRASSPLSPSSFYKDSEDNHCVHHDGNEVVEGIVAPPQEHYPLVVASPLSPSSSGDNDDNDCDHDCNHHDANEVVEGAAPQQEQHPSVVASLVSPSLSEDNDDNDCDDNHHDANEVDEGAAPPQEQQQLVVASPLSPSLSLSSSAPPPAPPPPVIQLPPPPEEQEATLWWSEMENRVDRYHRSFTASKELASLDTTPATDLGLGSSRRAYEEFAEHQNQLGKVMAVALYKGIAITKDKYELGIEMMKQHHKQELQDLQDSHQQQMNELNNDSFRANSVALSGTNTHHRNDVFRQRYKNRMNHSDVDYDDTRSAVVYGTVTKTNNIPGIDAATEVASTVYSNMSCRELSMDRYRLKLIKQMKRGKKKQQSQSVANVSVSGGGDGTNDHAAQPITVNVATIATIIDTTDTVDEDRTNKKDNAGDSESDNETNNNAEEIQRLLNELQFAERRQKLLEKQLQQAGVVLAEDIPYQLAKEKVASISARMNEIGSSQVIHEDPQIQKQLRQEYFRLEKDMAKYMTALSLTDEYVEEQQRIEEEWESSNYQENQLALCAIRSYMPVNIRRMTNEELASVGVGAGGIQQGLSPDMIKKFRRTNVLQLLRVDPAVISKWHPSTLEAYRVTGLSVTERRALHHHLLPVGQLWNDHSTTIGGGSGGDPMNNRKLSWYQTMRINFKEALNQYERHIKSTSTTCTEGLGLNHYHECNLIGKQCPVRANLAIDYFSNSDGNTAGSGFPMDDIYEDPVTVVGSHDDRKLHKKTPAEVIAEARGSGGAGAVDQQRPPMTTRTITTTTAVIEKQKHPHNQLGGPVILPTTTTTPKKKSRMPSPASSSASSIQPPTRSKNKRMMKTNSSSSFLAAVEKQQNPFLAAIAARRID